MNDSMNIHDRYNMNESINIHDQMNHHDDDDEINIHVPMNEYSSFNGSINIHGSISNTQHLHVRQCSLPFCMVGISTKRRH